MKFGFTADTNTFLQADNSRLSLTNTTVSSTTETNHDVGVSALNAAMVTISDHSAITLNVSGR
jgi:hypothetical protein